MEMVRALSKGDISMNFNETEKFSILSGMDVFVPAIAMGAIGISHMWYKWVASIVIVCVSVYLLFLFNYKKYNMVKGKTSVSFKRAVVIDGICASVGLLYVWAFLYIPDPLTWEAFITPPPETELIFPFGAMILGILPITPSLLTNKKIIKEVFHSSGN